MDITLDKKGNTEASIIINLKEEDYQPKVEEKIKEYRKKANLKGFRPGKVPAGIIKKMYGKSIKVEEINQLLTESLPQYIRENKLNIVGEPMPDVEAAQNIDWDTQSDFAFTYHVGFVNDFDYALSKDVTIPQYNIEVGDKEINETIENLLKQFGTHEHVDKSEAEDTLKGKVTQEESGIDHEAVIDLTRHDAERVKAFVGVNKGETVTFDLREVFPDDLQVAPVVGKKHDEVADLAGEFKFTVEDIQRKKAAELNQELYDKVFGPEAVKSEEEFKLKVKETLQENYQRETDNLLQRDIRDHYINSTNIEMPDAFLKQWLLSKYEGQITEEQVEQEFDEYLKELKWNLISNKMAEDKEVKVEHEDVKATAQQIIEQQLGQSGLLQQLGDKMDVFVENYLQGENGNNYMTVFNQARSEKLNNLIKESITVEEKQVNVEEFKEQVNKNN